MIDFHTVSYLTGGLLIIIGVGAIVFIDNIIKKIMGAMFVTDGVNLILITMGYRPGGIVPIVLEKIGNVSCTYPNPSQECINAFAAQAGYPLPFALVLTNIVIGAATMAVMLGLTIRLYHKYHSLSAEKILSDSEEGDAQ